jgi:hypothetical protein
MEKSEGSTSDRMSEIGIEKVPEIRNTRKIKKSYFMIAIVVIFLLVIVVIVWRMRKVKPSVSNVSESLKKLSFPTGIVAETENGSIYVKWTEVKDAESYVMHYSNTSGFSVDDARIIEGIPEGGFKITKVPPGTYYYRMSSVNAKGKSEWSEENSITVGTCKPPLPPQNVTAAVNQSDPSEVLISWTPDTTGDGYILYVNANSPPTGHEGNTLVVKIDNPSAYEHSLQGASQGKWYAALAVISTYCGISDISSPIELK